MLLFATAMLLIVKAWHYLATAIVMLILSFRARFSFAQLQRISTVSEPARPPVVRAVSERVPLARRLGKAVRVADMLLFRPHANPHHHPGFGE